MRFLRPTFILCCLMLALLLLGSQQTHAQSPTPSPLSAEQLDQLIEKAEEDGTVRVIVGLSVAFQPEGNLSRRAAQQQQVEIANAQDVLLQRFAGHELEAYTVYETIPYMALSVDAATLRDLMNSSLVTSIEEDLFMRTTLSSSTSVIGAPAAWADGHEGTDQAVVILDTGIDAGHSFFGGRVVAEACFSNAGGSGGAVSLCPNGSASQTGSGAADATTAVCLGGSLCDHGTHVAGIAAGNGSSFDGVARGADIIAIQVFTRIDDVDFCGGASSTPCIVSARSDLIRALEYVRTTLNNNHNIAAVNMSLGGGRHNNQAQCDSENASTKTAIDNLRSLNIASVIASGNNGFTNALAAPGCISSAVGVGATTDGDSVARFSNSHQMVDLLAPGVSIESSIPGGGFINYQGTSMATPHVAGAWTVLKGIQPSATVDQILSALQNTGVSVRDTRAGGSVTKPRIQLDAAADELGPSTAPSITVNPNQLQSTLSANTTEVQTLNINNNGTGDLSWTIDEEQPARTSTSILAQQPFAAGEDAAPVAESSSENVSLSGNTELVEKFGQIQRRTIDETTISHSNSQTVQSQNSVACRDQDTGLHAANSYVRIFDLANDFNINSEFNVTAVEFGVESAEGAGGNQPVSVNLYLLEDNTLMPIGMADVNLSDQALTIASVPVNGTVPAGSVLVVEVLTPNGQNEGNSFLIGSNSAGESDPSYIYAPDCNVNSVTPLSNIGFPNMHIVMNVKGNEGMAGSCTPGNIPWVSLSQTSGTTGAGNTSQVNVTFNTNGLAEGTYTGNLCINSNAPQQPQIQVPLSLVVQAGDKPTPTPSPTPSPSDAILRTDNYQVAVDGNVTVKVEADNVPSPGLAAANVSLSYDNTVIRPTSCTIDPAFTGTCNTTVSGEVQFNILSTSGVQADFDIVEIVFEAIGQANERSTLDLNANQFTNSSGATIGVTVQDGSVTISQTLGDVSCDDQVTVVDALYILQYDVNQRQVGNSCPLANNTLLFANCDVNNDNSCNLIDALFVLQCDVNISNVFCPARSASPASQDQPPESAGSATVEIGQHNVEPLSTVNVPITGSTGNTALAAATIEVKFDPSVVQSINCQVAFPFLGECNVDNENGVILFSALSASGVTGDFTLANITWEGAASGTTALDLQIQAFADSSGNTITTSDVDGQISVTSSNSSEKLFLPLVRK